ncbi:phosphotransferase [Phycisphaerales bacterium AB-hyl4]|uniref:Phosphotransferase n=1 Tax=Natronomicrosphaera hydrolytica TaxID=3242702 RepID=A0ABV4U3V1_9BACT
MSRRVKQTRRGLERRWRLLHKRVVFALRERMKVPKCLWLVCWHRWHRQGPWARSSRFVKQCLRIVEQATPTPAGEPLPRVRPVEVDGQGYYLRMYRLFNHRDQRHCAAALEGMKLARNTPIRTATLCHAMLLFRRGSYYVAVLEEAMAAGKGKLRTPETGEMLGRDIAHWHEIPTRLNPWIKVGLARTYRRRLDVEPVHERLPVGSMEMVDRVRGLLGDPDFFGPIVTSHTDIHSWNVLLFPEGGLGWIDLESVNQRPARFDLAVATLRMLWFDVAAVDRFEQAYFAIRPGEWDGWRKYRLDWYLLISVLKGYRRLCGPGPAGRDEHAVEIWVQQGVPAMARGLAAMQMQERGQPTSEMVRELLDRAEAMLADDPRFANWREHKRRVEAGTPPHDDVFEMLRG